MIVAMHNSLPYSMNWNNSGSILDSQFVLSIATKMIEYHSNNYNKHKTVCMVTTFSYLDKLLASYVMYIAKTKIPYYRLLVKHTSYQTSLPILHKWTTSSDGYQAGKNSIGYLISVDGISLIIKLSSRSYNDRKDPTS